jgi:hypothetical protein
MKQKDRRELRSAISKKSAQIENPEDHSFHSHDSAIETPDKEHSCADKLETAVKGRGRGRPKKILITQTSSKARLPIQDAKQKQSEFGLVTPDAKYSPDQLNLLKTGITNITTEPQIQPNSSTSKTSKRVVSTRPNRGVNPRYDKETYLGQTNPISAN